MSRLTLPKFLDELDLKSWFNMVGAAPRGRSQHGVPLGTESTLLEASEDIRGTAHQVTKVTAPKKNNNAKLKPRRHPSPPYYLDYAPLVGAKAPGIQRLWLEETRPGGYPLALRDEDGDGLKEISLIKVGLNTFGDPISSPLPLTSYFDERAYQAFPSLVAVQFESMHTSDTLEGMKSLASSRDFDGANLYFQLLAHGEDNPLKKLRPFLHVFLNLSAVHSESNVPDWIQLEKNPYGFSVTSDGRWRIDCGIFAQIARRTLKDIEGLSFNYVYMHGPSQAHVVLLVSDSQDRHLLIDNGSVLYFEDSDPKKFLVERFKSRGYEKFGTGGSEWKPFGKHQIFYP